MVTEQEATSQQRGQGKSRAEELGSKKAGRLESWGHVGPPRPSRCLVQNREHTQVFEKIRRINKLELPKREGAFP